MKEGWISVVVPAYNAGPWLGACLDSLLAQTYPNLEIIVVNDGSTDNTGAVLAEYADKNSNIVAINQENGGVTAARLRGVSAASGDWIVFCDGDDLVDKRMYEVLLKNALSHQAEISHCGFRVDYPDGRQALMHGSGLVKVQDRQTALRDLLEERIVEPSLCSKLFRKELFAGLEEKMDKTVKNNEDMLMNFFLFSRAEKAVFEDVCLYHYRIHPGSASRRRLDKHLIYDPIRVRQIILDCCTEAVEPDARRALARMCLVSYRQLIWEDDPIYRDDIRKVRELISQQKPFVSLLSKRNGFLVCLIGTAPWAFDFAYRIYARLTGKEDLL